MISSILSIAKETIDIEKNSISKLLDYVDDSFEKIVEEVYSSTGRLVVTGIGKSANIANKIVATLNSTGTPAIFMHAADAIHGDLGLVQKEDIVLCISKSGNSPEIKALAPLIKSRKNKLIGMVGNLSSFLAQQSDYIINSTVEKEACPNNLAPTSSTTAQLVMGDVLAVCLMHLRGFTDKDFAHYHPGGALGKKLYLKMGDLIVDQNSPKVDVSASIKEIILEISSKRLGATIVLENNQIKGIITDGDLRRMLERNENHSNLIARDIMSLNPITIDVKELAVKAFQIMEEKSITQIAVTENNNYKGIVHLHDILREGIY